MGDFVENSSTEKTKNFLEDVLQTYLTYEKRKKLGDSQNSKDTPLVNVSVIDFDIGPGFSDQDVRMSTLSDLLSLKVTYTIEGDDSKIVESLIVKIPPNDKAEREMAQAAQVDKREIHFYTQSLIEMQEWVADRIKETNPNNNAPGQGQNISIAVPKCLFAKYHLDPNQEEGQSLQDAESVLVLQDLRPLGFTMRDFNNGLTIKEAMSALKEIAKVHAISWSMQEVTGELLDEKWPFAYRAKKAASAYKVMIEQGFPRLVEFLENQKPDGQELLEKLKALHPKAAELLCELLDPPPPPAPACLTHMDFWINNLLFKKVSSNDSSNNEINSKSSSDEDEGEIECKILDWQMMAISRPTHDIAVLLVTSLRADLRKQYMEQLLRHYWSVFEETAKILRVELPFDYEFLETEYKKSQLLALLLVIGSIDLALDGNETRTRLMQALRDMAEEELI